MSARPEPPSGSVLANRRGHLVEPISALSLVRGLDNTELVSFGVGHDRPPQTVLFNDLERSATKRVEPLDFRSHVVGGEVEVQAVLDNLVLGNGLEEKPDDASSRLPSLRRRKAVALMIQCRVAEHRGPEAGKTRRIPTVERRISHAQSHPIPPWSDFEPSPDRPSPSMTRPAHEYPAAHVLQLKPGQQES